MTYQDFLRSKIQLAKETGLDIDPSEVNPRLLPHQRDGVVWAVKGGCRALFESFGMGKTVQELEQLARTDRVLRRRYPENQRRLLPRR